MKAVQKRMSAATLLLAKAQDATAGAKPSRDSGSIWWSVLTGVGQVEPGSLEESVLRELGALPASRRKP
jgi:hypothetical protein